MLVYFHAYFKILTFEQPEEVGNREHDKEAYTKFRDWMISVFTVTGAEKDQYEIKLLDLMLHNFMEIRSLDQFKTARVCLPRDVDMMDNITLQQLNSRFHRSLFQPEKIDNRYTSGPSAFFCTLRDDTNNQIPETMKTILPRFITDTKIFDSADDETKKNIRDKLATLIEMLFTLAIKLEFMVDTIVPEAEVLLEKPGLLNFLRDIDVALHRFSLFMPSVATYDISKLLDCLRDMVLFFKDQSFTDENLYKVLTLMLGFFLFNLDGRIRWSQFIKGMLTTHNNIFKY